MDDDKAEGGASQPEPKKTRQAPLRFTAGVNGAEEKDDIAEPVASLFGGVGPEEIPEFRRAQELIPAYQLLHGLVGRNELDFLIRAAALEALVARGRASFSQHELNEVLYWLSEYGRDRTVRVLREAGWLEYRPGPGDIITNAGRSAYEILQLLRRKLESGEILPTVASLEHAISVGADKLGLLDSLYLKLTQDYAEIDDALASHSEVVLKATAKKIEEALAHSSHINALLDRIPKDTPRTWHRIREIHDQLSRLHGRVAELHSAITEVGRQYLRLTAGLTTQQIVEALMRKPKELLAQAGREALLPALTSPSLLNTEAVAYRAAAHFSQERIQTEAVRWEEPPEITHDSREQEAIPPEVVALLAVLTATMDGKDPVVFSQLIPRDGKTESFLRASLLPLVGGQSAGEGIAGRFSVLTLDVHAEGDGWPDDLKDGPLAALTPGTVRPLRLDEVGGKKS